MHGSDDWHWSLTLPCTVPRQSARVVGRDTVSCMGSSIKHCKTLLYESLCIGCQVLVSAWEVCHCGCDIHWHDECCDIIMYYFIIIIYERKDKYFYTPLQRFRRPSSHDALLSRERPTRRSHTFFTPSHPTSTMPSTLAVDWPSVTWSLNNRCPADLGIGRCCLETRHHQV